MPSNFLIKQAANRVKQGGIIAYPTDTVYGLGCKPDNQQAVKQLIQLKQRPHNKPFILLASHQQQLQPYINLNEQQQQLIQQQKQATSWITQATKHTPYWLTGKNNSIAFRLCAHPVVEQLCTAIGCAILSTSANYRGQNLAHNKLELHLKFHGQIDKILATQQKLQAPPSKIIDLYTQQVIRG